MDGGWSHLNAACSRIADGDLETAGPSASSDEIGRMANALETFRANGLQMQSLQREQQTSAQRAAALRKADMQRLADEFESAVGKIIHTVSSRGIRAGSFGQYADINRGPDRVSLERRRIGV